MKRQSQQAADFVRELAALTDRLAARDIVIGSLRAEYSSFGHWQLVARKNHEAVRFIFDGRDGYLTIEGSSIHDHSAPNEWREELIKGFDSVSGDKPLQFVDDYLRTRFPI